jgi:hypothetical protein
MTFWFGLTVGIFFGASVGFLAAGLMNMARGN